MEKETTCFKPKGFMFIITLLCGFLILALSVYLLGFAIANKKYLYILLSIFGFAIAFSEIKKMISYKIIIKNEKLYIAKQNFSFKFWQTDSITIDLYNIEDIEIKNIEILIKTGHTNIKIWSLPFSKKQINTIVSTIKEKSKNIKIKKETNL